MLTDLAVYTVKWQLFAAGILILSFSLIIVQPSYRLHCASCPSIFLSVCPMWACNSKTKKCRKIKIGVNMPPRFTCCPQIQ